MILFLSKYQCHFRFCCCNIYLRGLNPVIYWCRHQLLIIQLPFINSLWLSDAMCGISYGQYLAQVHDDVIKWDHFPRYWPFVRGIPRSRWIPARWPVTRSFDVFFDLRLNKRLSKQPWGWWSETPPWSLWRQCNEWWPVPDGALSIMAKSSYKQTVGKVTPVRSIPRSYISHIKSVWNDITGHFMTAWYLKISQGLVGTRSVFIASQSLLNDQSISYIDNHWWNKWCPFGVENIFQVMQRTLSLFE